MIYLQLFLSFCQIGILGFGGGYAILPIIKDITVNTNHWLTNEQFLHLVTISQLTPGPILINSATFVGSKVGGILGAICATLGSIMPSCIIVICFILLYNKFKKLAFVQHMLSFLKPAVVGLIASYGVTIVLMVIFKNVGDSNFDFIGIGLLIASIFAIRLFKLNPILVICISGIVGMGLYLLGGLNIVRSTVSSMLKE